MGGALATGRGLLFTSHSPKCFKIFIITSESSMMAITCMVPLQLGHTSGSTSYILCIRRAQFYLNCFELNAGSKITHLVQNVRVISSGRSRFLSLSYLGHSYSENGKHQAEHTTGLIANMDRLSNQRHFFDVVRVRRGALISQSATMIKIRTKEIRRIAISCFIVRFQTHQARQ